VDRGDRFVSIDPGIGIRAHPTSEGIADIVHHRDAGVNRLNPTASERRI
jgi:hypothetical protein